MVNKIKEILSEMRPFIQAHGGDIQFASYQDSIVNVRLHGACINCPMSLYTLKLGILERLQQEIPEIRDIVTID